MAVPQPSASDALILPALAARFAAGVARAVRSKSEARHPSAGSGLAGKGVSSTGQKTPASAGVTEKEGASPEAVAFERLALAVSGGPDSMAMLALAAAAFPGRVIAATFDHGLRAESAAEAAMVANWCSDQGIPHATLTPAMPLPRRAVQAAAREARYTALSAWATGQGAGLLATAHHADDQAETFLMRAHRASGVTGLAGIRRRRSLGTMLLIRPMLDWRRADLAALVEQQNLPVVQDPSNHDPRYTRTRARRWLMQAPGLDAANIARAAGNIAELADDLDAFCEWAWQARFRDGGTLDVEGLPRALRRQLVRRLIAVVRRDAGIDRPAFGLDTGVEPLLDALNAGIRATQAGISLTPRDQIWHAEPAPPRR